MRWAYPYRLGALARSDGDGDGDGVTIGVSGPVDRVWHLAAHQRQWRFVSQPTRRVIAVLNLTTEQSWRLLTNNLPAEARHDLRVSGGESVVQAFLQARAIIGVPK